MKAEDIQASLNQKCRWHREQPILFLAVLPLFCPKPLKIALAEQVARTENDLKFLGILVFHDAVQGKQAQMNGRLCLAEQGEIVLLFVDGLDLLRIEAIRAVVALDLKQIDDVVFSLDHHVYLRAEDSFFVVFLGGPGVGGGMDA